MARANVTSGSKQVEFRLPALRSVHVIPLIGTQALRDVPMSIALKLEDTTLMPSPMNSFESNMSGVEFREPPKFDVPTGTPYQLQLSVEGYRPVRHAFQVPAGKDPFPIRVQLTPAPVFSGRLIHFDSTATLEGFTVEALPDGKSLAKRFVNDRPASTPKASTDARGAFRLEGVPTAQFAVAIRAPKGQLAGFAFVTPTAEGQTHSL